MSAANISRSLQIALAASAGLLALFASAMAWGISARPTSERALALTGQFEVEPPETTTTSSSTTSTSTTSSTSTTTSTSTTVKPKPVTTVAPRPAPRPTAPPTTAPPVRAAAAPVAPAGTSQEQRCAAAQQWVVAQGLPLPAGWGFRCPGKAIVGGAERWGVACWNCEGTGSWIAVDIGRIGSSDASLRYVIAHETCHAIDYTTTGLTSEVGADLCAALHGAPHP